MGHPVHYCKFASQHYMYVYSYSMHWIFDIIFSWVLTSKAFIVELVNAPYPICKKKMKVANKTVSEIDDSLLSAIFQQNPKFILSILNHCMHFFKSWWQEHFSNLQLLHKSIYISILLLFLLITLNHSWDFHCVKIIHLLELFSAGLNIRWCCLPRKCPQTQPPLHWRSLNWQNFSFGKVC